MIKVIFPDKSVKKFEKGTKVIDVAKSISEGLARKVISASYNDEIVETESLLNEDGEIRLFTWDDDEGKQAFWHSSAHILAQTIKLFYPKSKLTIGPSIENGFYYDVDFGDDVFSEKDFERVESKFLEIAREDHRFKIKSVTKKDALDFYNSESNEYKIELIQGLDDGSITFCDHSDFTDLCKGGHIPSTGLVKAVKLLNVAGAYWRGDEKNNQLTRVYGISFPKQKLLIEYLELLDKARERDHRKIGKELELFTFSNRVGHGLPLWLPNGTELRDRLQNFLEDAQKRAGYKKVMSSHIGAKELYETSGHYEKYGADSFQPISTPNETETFLLRPMNCPHHCEIYNAKPQSYRDLPLRLAEFGTVYRHEQSGELHGLSRVRGFTVDDAHIFCTPDQVESCLLYTSPSPRDRLLSRMPSSA